MMTAGSVQPRPGVTPYQARDGAPVFLSDMIIELGLAEVEHVESAVETARSSGETVGRILVREGRLSEDQLARALAARYGLNHIDLAEFDVDPDAANLLPKPAAQRYKAVPIGFEADGSMLVAMADPSDSLAISDIAFMTKLEVQAAVAGADLIADLVGRLPLPPDESRRSSFPPPAPPEAPPVDSAFEVPQASVPAPVPAPAPEASVAPPPAPAVDEAELAALRAELEEATAALDSERSKHAQDVAELKQQSRGDDHLQSEVDQGRAELDQTRSELEQARSELSETRGELDNSRAEIDRRRGEIDQARAELERVREDLERQRADFDTQQTELEQVRGERDHQRGELEQVRSEREQQRSELEQARSERDQQRGELDAVRVQVEEQRAELDEARLATARLAEAETKLAESEAKITELSESEQRVNEAHATLQKMRREFELERETHAATERDLRAKLASESEQRDALTRAEVTMQKRIEVLRTQNAALLDAYATAKRWSAEFARGARELTATLEQPVLDDALQAQQQQGSEAPPDDPERDPGRFARDDEES